MKPIETFYVIKTKTGYRYRADGEDYGAGYIGTLDKVIFKYHKSMTDTDIMTVETLWGNKIITEGKC